jgi:hypothetical protein
MAGGSRSADGGICDAIFRSSNSAVTFPQSICTVGVDRRRAFRRLALGRQVGRPASEGGVLRRLDSDAADRHAIAEVRRAGGFTRRPQFIVLI